MLLLGMDGKDDMSKKLYGSRKPKRLWVIFDPLDGAHLFLTENAAKKQLRQWEKEAETSYDSVWDMSDPVEYALMPNEKVRV